MNNNNYINNNNDKKRIEQLEIENQLLKQKLLKYKKFKEQLDEIYKNKFNEETYDLTPYYECLGKQQNLLFDNEEVVNKYYELYIKKFGLKL